MRHNPRPQPRLFAKKPSDAGCVERSVAITTYDCYGWTTMKLMLIPDKGTPCQECILSGRINFYSSTIPPQAS